MADYDFKLAKEIVNKLTELDVLEEASLGMHEDWYWTAKTIWSDGKFSVELNEDTSIGGIQGSSWATPVLQVELKDGTEKTFNCFKGQPNEDVLNKISKMNVWVSGCLSSEVQDQRAGTKIEDFKS